MQELKDIIKAESEQQKYRPFELIYTEVVNKGRKEARKREKYWKSGFGKEKLRNIRDSKKLR